MMFSHDICIKIDLKKMSMYIELNVDNKITITYISHYYLELLHLKFKIKDSST